ncbi:MAG: sigma-70 family RNA polymerase sigma factor [Firmicutes bacterium]|nr:sigma-70 family RNA polymerase sigma factor [Bacillota bacterium]
MDAKEYLKLAWKVDQQIDDKIEQINILKELSQKTTAVLSGMPGKSTRNIHSREEVIARMMDSEESLNQEVLKLIEIRENVRAAIAGVENVECRMLLEERYLCYHGWNEIAEDMGYSLDNVYKLHRKALKEVYIAPNLLNA